MKRQSQHSLYLLSSIYWKQPVLPCMLCAIINPVTVWNDLLIFPECVHTRLLFATWFIYGKNFAWIGSFENIMYVCDMQNMIRLGRTYVWETTKDDA